MNSGLHPAQKRGLATVINPPTIRFPSGTLLLQSSVSERLLNGEDETKSRVLLQAIPDRKKRERTVSKQFNSPIAAQLIISFPELVPSFPPAKIGRKS
jgi:hypothetical protein